MIGNCEKCGEYKILVAVTPVETDKEGNHTFPPKAYWCRECVYKNFENVLQFIAIL